MTIRDIFYSPLVAVMLAFGCLMVTAESIGKGFAEVEKYQKENKELKQTLEVITAKLTNEQQQKEHLRQTIMGVRKDIHPQVADEWATAFYEAGQETGLDPRLFVGISIVESGIVHRGPYGYTLVSHAGAEGIMQVMGRYWGYGAIPFVRKPDDLRHPSINIKAGAFIFLHYLKMYKGDFKLALTAYNRGEYAVNRAIRRGKQPFNGYAKRVYKRWELLGIKMV